MLTAAFRLLILFFGCKLVSSRTQADEHRTHKADIRLLKGFIRFQPISQCCMQCSHDDISQAHFWERSSSFKRLLHTRTQEM